MMEQEIIKYDNGAFCIRNFFNKTECDELIKSAENKGFEKAKIQSYIGEEFDLEVRNNDRVFFDDYDLARRLFLQMEQFLPTELDAWIKNWPWTVSCLNERFRFYRYSALQYFKWHMDGSFKRDHSEVSMLSVIFYLNDDFSGGETEFETFKIKPEKGMVLIFPHKLMHQGTAVKKGDKYVLRTDVMYSR